MRQEYRDAQEIARRLVREVGEPIFYGREGIHVETSAALFKGDPLVRKAVDELGARPDPAGHGLGHATKVAVDAGVRSLTMVWKLSKASSLPCEISAW